MSEPELFVVLEYNQASGQPELAIDDVYDRLSDAIQDAQDRAGETKAVGRRERYAVASLQIEWTPTS